MRILVIASPVGPIGDPITGGVTRFLESSIAALAILGHEVDVIAPTGSRPMEGAGNFEVAGALQPTASGLVPESDWPVPPDSVLANMMREAFDRQDDYALVLNLSHDWLPYYLTPFFRVPLLHVPNLCHSTLATDACIARVARQSPGHVGVLSRFQATALSVPAETVVAFGLDPQSYPAGAGDGGGFAWAGRIVPEKGLHRAAAISRAAGRPLSVAGPVHDQAYWDGVLREYGDVVSHVGFLDQPGLAAFLGRAQALLQTQTWEEAFGIVTVESLLCGTPVLALTRGANAELIEPRVTGFVVNHEAPIGDIADAAGKAARLPRDACRSHAIARFSLEAMAGSYGQWFRGLPPR